MDRTAKPGRQASAGAAAGAVGAAVAVGLGERRLAEPAGQVERVARAQTDNC